MFNFGLYRICLLPLLLAVAIVAFSPQAQHQRALQPALAPDAFDEAKAISQLQELSARYPRRQAGSLADQSLGREIQRQFQQAKGFQVSANAATLPTINGKKKLLTVQAKRVGLSDQRIVVVAARDTQNAQSTTQLSGTAALLELARLFGAPRRTRASLLFVSVSGQSTGQAGMRQLAKKLRPSDSVLVLGDLAAKEGKPEIIPWSNNLTTTPLLLQETARFAVKQETDVVPRRATFLEQWIRFAFPATQNPAGQFLAQGIPAFTLQVGKEKTRRKTTFDKERFANLGRSVLSVMSSLDASKNLPQETSVQTIQWKTKEFPTWAIILLALSGLLAPLVSSIDSLARANRSKLLSGSTHKRFFALFVAVFCGALMALVTVLLGIFTLPRALPASDLLGFRWTIAAPLLAGIFTTTSLLIFLHLKGMLFPQTGGVTALVTLTLTLACFTFANPFLAVIWIPTLHLWLFASDSVLIRSRLLRALFFFLGLIPITLSIAQVSHYLGTDWLETVNAITITFAGGGLGVLQTIFWVTTVGCSLGLFLSTLNRNDAHFVEPEITTRAVASYAGPGSLGGTASALADRERSQF